MKISQVYFLIIFVLALLLCILCAEFVFCLASSASSSAQVITINSSIISAYQDELFNDKTTPYLGNSRGTIRIVEFFDYQCPTCKVMVPVIDDLVQQDHRLKLIMKDWPILGLASQDAARVGLIAAEQGKYSAFRNELAKQPAPLEDSEIWTAANLAGMNLSNAKNEMNAPWVNAELTNNSNLASSMNLTGTPTFLIGNYLIAGGFTEVQMIKFIESVN